MRDFTTIQSKTRGGAEVLLNHPQRIVPRSKGTARRTVLIACLVFRVPIQRTESLVFSRPPTHPSRVSMVSMVSIEMHLSNSHFGRPGAPLHHPMVVSHVVGVYGRISRVTRNGSYMWGVHPGGLWPAGWGCGIHVNYLGHVCPNTLIG